MEADFLKELRPEDRDACPAMPEQVLKYTSNQCPSSIHTTKEDSRCSDGDACPSLSPSLPACLPACLLACLLACWLWEGGGKEVRWHTLPNH